jgi:MYXO-CTERM domain-containing protein
MNYNDIKKITNNGLLVLSLAFLTALPIDAQSNSNRDARNDNTPRTTVVQQEDDTDWGWLGLLGLLGLAGLLPKKRKVEVQEFRDARTDQPNQTGSTNAR